MARRLLAPVDMSAFVTADPYRDRWLAMEPAAYEQLTEELEGFLALVDRPLLAACRGRVLELGCGTGRVLGQLAASPAVDEAIGIDLSPRMVDVARRRGHAVVQGSASELPFPDASFDTVVCAFYTMRDLDRPRVYAEAARVLRPGGVLAFGLRSYYPVYAQTLWRRFIRRRRLPASWRTLDGSDGVEDNLRSVRAELAALTAAGFTPRDVSGLRLLPFVRRWVGPGYWHGPRAAALGTDVFFIAEKR